MFFTRFANIYRNIITCKLEERYCIYLNRRIARDEIKDVLEICRVFIRSRVTCSGPWLLLARTIYIVGNSKDPVHNNRVRAVRKCEKRPDNIYSFPRQWKFVSDIYKIIRARIMLKT